MGDVGCQGVGGAKGLFMDRIKLTFNGFLAFNRNGVSAAMRIDSV